MPQAQQVAVDQVGAEVVLEQLQVAHLLEGAVCRQVLAVVEHDVGVLDAGVLYVNGRGVQPADAGVGKQDGHFRAGVHQVERVGHGGHTVPGRQFGQGGAWVFVVMEDAYPWQVGLMGAGTLARAWADPMLLTVFIQRR